MRMPSRALLGYTSPLFFHFKKEIKRKREGIVVIVTKSQASLEEEEEEETVPRSTWSSCFSFIFSCDCFRKRIRSPKKRERERAPPRDYVLIVFNGLLVIPSSGHLQSQTHTHSRDWPIGRSDATCIVVWCVVLFCMYTLTVLFFVFFAYINVGEKCSSPSDPPTAKFGSDNNNNKARSSSNFFKLLRVSGRASVHFRSFTVASNSLRLMIFD